jgi:hypothetical protein
MSRPSSSVPSQYSEPGGSNLLLTAIEFGSIELIHGAKIAKKPIIKRVINPNSTDRL